MDVVYAVQWYFTKHDRDQREVFEDQCCCRGLTKACRLVVLLSPAAAGIQGGGAGAGGSIVTADNHFPMSHSRAVSLGVVVCSTGFKNSDGNFGSSLLVFFRVFMRLLRFLLIFVNLLDFF